jgi:hypothetical protein
MNEPLTVLAPAGVALAPNGALLAVRAVYPTYADEDAANAAPYGSLPLPLA